MPPVNQGSRGLMAAWIVVMAIIGVVSSIIAIYFYVDANKINNLYNTQNKEYNDVLSPSMINGEDMQALKSLREADPSLQGMKLFEVAMEQSRRLSKTINGGEQEGAAIVAAQNSIKKLKDVGVTPAGDNLGAAIDAALNEINARRTGEENNKKDSEQSKTALEQNVKATQAQIETLTKHLETARTETATAQAQLKEVSDKQRGDFDTSAGELRKQLEVAQTQINTLNSDTAGLNKTIEQQKLQIAQLQEKLAAFRVDPAKAVVRQGDGKVSRIVDQGNCFIDVGSGDQVTRGLTFEVFDKFEGIPEPGDPATEENLPKGKASIEVVDVFPGGSKCKVTRLSPGAVLSEGDIIVNLVYDRNTKYNFVVYGNFDLDQNGTATPQDAEQVKRIVTNFGGNVVDKINVDTDFVVLGKEPAIPEKPAEPDPLLQRQYEEAMAAYDEYGRISMEARAYRIPILNQNRFLYLCGYYESAKR